MLTGLLVILVIALTWRLSSGPITLDFLTDEIELAVNQAVAPLRVDIEAGAFTFRRKHWAHGLHAPYWWLRCLFWKTQNRNWFIRQYQRFLEWDILKRPALTRALARIADPVMGKSVVLYFEKQSA